jgi:hypothetical protein
MKLVKVFAFVLFPLLAVVPMAKAQTVTGSITGTVVDGGGALLVGARVQSTNQISKQVRGFNMSGNGTFIFPADYDLKVTHPGFKTYVQRGIPVGTLEKVDLHTSSKSVTSHLRSRLRRKRPDSGVQRSESLQSGQPEHSLAINCNVVNGACTPGGANTNAAFGEITTAALPARHAVVSIRFTF